MDGDNDNIPLTLVAHARRAECDDAEALRRQAQLVEDAQGRLEAKHRGKAGVGRARAVSREEKV